MSSYDYWKTLFPDYEQTEDSEEERSELEFQEARNTLLESAEELHTVAFEIDYPKKSLLESLTREIDQLIERYST